MLDIRDGIITLHRGDDGAISVVIMQSNGQPYNLQDDDVLKFTVRLEPDPDSDVLLETESDDGVIILTHDQTEDIPAGKYSCSVQLVRANGMQTTVFPKLKGKGYAANLKNFIVDAEVNTDV